ncbi:MAG TPA: hypothetical protein VNN10_05865 [Dehalococcoidia bacterium]|nr:hypothetical protein [Dehalococcoidia bacterium]
MRASAWSGLAFVVTAILAAACSGEASEPPPITETPVLIEASVNRADCNAIRGRVYLSHTERAWFLANCLGGSTQVNRGNCDIIRGTAYLSDAERSWFIANCGGEEPPAAEPRECHPSYVGACLATNLGDYDCADRGEDGPNYVRGRIRVVGRDEFLLDRDGDGFGCE